MEPVNIKEARKHLSDLVTAAEKGESTIIVRRGKKVAQIDPVARPQKVLPDLKAFREDVKTKGKSLAQTVVDERSKERY